MHQVLKAIIVWLLTTEAKILLRRQKPIIIAVTGSVGKTSTKDAIYSVLKKHVSTRKSEKSFNSDIGVPLTVLGLPNAWNNPILWIKNLFDGFTVAFFAKSYPAYLILEMGVDRPGDMAKLTTWIKPDIVVLTRFPDVPVHVEFFSGPEAVVEEKMRLVSALKPEGVVIYNHDDEIIKRALSTVRQKTIGFSRFLPSQFTASHDQIWYEDDQPSGIMFTVQHVEETTQVRINGVIGMQPIYAITAAIAVGMQCGVSLPETAAALGEHMPAPGRMRILQGIKGSIIIDDSYNASPIATEQALLTIKELKHVTRKIAVLGDMLELGRFSAQEHEKIGIVAANCTDRLLTVGIRAQKIAEGALENGIPESEIFQYEDSGRAGRELQAMLEPGDIVLIKASQGIRAEQIVEEIMREPERASELLVRQDQAWRYKT